MVPEPPAMRQFTTQTDLVEKENNQLMLTPASATTITMTSSASADSTRETLNSTSPTSFLGKNKVPFHYGTPNKGTTSGALASPDTQDQIDKSI